MHRGRVAADEDERLRREAADLPRGLEDAVVLERVHAGDPDDLRARPADLRTEAVSETEVHDRGLVAAGDERGGEVLEPERLDAEKRSQAEPFVARVGAQKENVHGASLIAGRPRL